MSNPESGYKPENLPKNSYTPEDFFVTEGPNKGAFVKEVAEDAAETTQRNGEPEYSNGDGNDLVRGRVYRRTLSAVHNEERAGDKSRFDVDFGEGGNLTDDEKRWINRSLLDQREKEFARKNGQDMVDEHKRLVEERKSEE